MLLLGTACTGRPGMSHPGNSLAPVSPADTEQMVDTTDGLARRIDQYLSAIETLGFSGAIIVENGGRVVLRRGYGLADRETRQPFTPATVQTMGSITKQITGAAILLLADRRTVGLHDSLSKYLAGVPADKQGITLHQLLTHQSGLPGSIGWDAEPIVADDYVARAMGTPLESEPGTRFEYSNVGYSLLGIIIEKVTGRGYEDFVREELLLPAGLLHTGYVRAAWRDGVLATGYRDNGEPRGTTGDGNWLPDGPGWHLRANGGLNTTVADMHRWLTVLRGAGPLRSEVITLWTHNHVVANDDFSYGYGWTIRNTELGRMITHTGGNPALSSAFAWFPEHELFIYIHGNTSRWAAAGLEEQLLMAGLDDAFAMPPLLTADPHANPALAAAHAGAYLVNGATIKLTADDTRLVAELSGQPALDAMLSHEAGERARFAELNDRTARAMQRVQAGGDDALEGMVDSATDPSARARSLIQFLERQGGLRSLTVIGTVGNVPGSRFADRGGSTTFVRAEFENRTRILSIFWRDNGTYLGAALGPLTDVPRFVLVPVAGGGYAGVEQEAPWRTQRLNVTQNCLIGQDVRACR